jgi:hypothetical protein
MNNRRQSRVFCIGMIQPKTIVCKIRQSKLLRGRFLLQPFAFRTMIMRDHGRSSLKAFTCPGFFSFLLLASLCTAQKNENVLQNYLLKPSEEIAAAIRTELASKDPSRRDKTVMFLSTLINSGNPLPKDQEILLRLAEDREAVGIASDIVTERLAGWYEEREMAQERSMPLYYPLIHLLSISHSKIAAMTLMMAHPTVGFDAFYRKSLFTNKDVIKVILSKLTALESKLCCYFPGKELIGTMQEIDFRLSMLAMYLEAARDKTSSFLSSDVEMNKFVLDCLEFGDGNMGRIVRTRAVELACILTKAGQKDFLPVVKKIAESDPCYQYKILPAVQLRLPQYDIKSKYYPVREKAGKELLNLNN